MCIFRAVHYFYMRHTHVKNSQRFWCELIIIQTYIIHFAQLYRTTQSSATGLLGLTRCWCGHLRNCSFRPSSLVDAESTWGRAADVFNVSALNGFHSIHRSFLHLFLSSRVLLKMFVCGILKTLHTPEGALGSILIPSPRIV